jgi:manganese/zinc/iron transport system ATP- binding protein
VTGDPSTTGRMASHPSQDAGAALSVRDLSVSYGTRRAIAQCTFHVPCGSIAGIIGPNGSGKTTLLKACLGLLPADSGTVLFGGRPLSQCRRDVAYMPQRESVDWDFPISALDVVSMGAHVRTGWMGMRARAAREMARREMAKLGIEGLADRAVGALSGGQQQRVFLARALAQGASTFVMDEPLASVDAASAKVVMDALQELRASGRTVVMVHHDLEMAREIFDWVVLLAGRVVGAGPVSEVMTERNLRLAYGGRLAWPGSVPPAEAVHGGA